MFDESSFQPNNIDDMWSRASHIDVGDDSIVRRLGDVVIKRYPSISESQLDLYKEVTGIVAGIVDGREIDTPIGPSILRVNPIVQVIESLRELTMYGISPFMEGENMHPLLLKKDQGAFNTFESLLEEMSEELIRETRIKGIHIIPYNVLKATPLEKESNQLVITDVASYVDRVARI